jgi:hypothetical protein
LRHPRSPSCLTVTALLLSVGCTQLEGRPPRDAAVSDAPSSDGDVADSTRDESDAPPCPSDAPPALDPRYTRLVSAAALGVDFTGAFPRAAFSDGAGHIYVVGTCSRCNAHPATEAALWRFQESDAALDLGFGVRGLLVDEPAKVAAHAWLAGAVDPMGRVVVVGHKGEQRGGLRAARILPSGDFDTTFGDLGRVTLEPSQVSPAIDSVLPYALRAEAASTLIVGSDAYTWQRSATRAFALRLRTGGERDAAFGNNGVLVDASLRGCFDVKRDGNRYVLACVSQEQARPVLLRLDERGRRSPWPEAEAASEHDLAPRGFQVRALLRDSAGRWLVAGAVSPLYNDANAPPTVVRYLSTGRPDASYGIRGVASLTGARQSFAYTFATPWALICEDRLVFGAILEPVPVLAVFDAHGVLVDSDTPGGVYPLAQGRGLGLVSAVIPVSPTSVIAVTAYNPSQFGFFHLRH